MKHSDFLTKLKSLKSQLHSKQKKVLPLSDKTQASKQNVCSCKDASGETKYLYTSKEELNYLLANKSISLYSYPCPYEKGWHLTKSSF